MPSKQMLPQHSAQERMWGCALPWNGRCQIKVCGSVICSQSWIFIWFLFESCLELCLDVVSLRSSLLLFFIYTLLFPYYTKALTKPLPCICSFFCICILMAFAVSATIVFWFLKRFSSPGLGDTVLLKSPFLIILWLLSCKTQNILYTLWCSEY